MIYFYVKKLNKKIQRFWDWCRTRTFGTPEVAKAYVRIPTQF